MKYSCYGCKHAPYKRDYPCTTCGKYVLAEDGESTIYVCTHWTPKENATRKEVVSMCEYCESKKNLLRYDKDIDCSEVLIEDKKISLAIADRTKINNKPVRHCYKIAIEYCPKCGRKL